MHQGDGKEPGIVPARILLRQVYIRMLRRSHSSSSGMSFPLPLLPESDNRRLWRETRHRSKNQVRYKSKITGTTVADVHRNLDKSAHLVSYKDEVTGSVWSLSPFPRSPTISVDTPRAHPTPGSILRMPGGYSDSRWWIIRITLTMA